MFQSKLSYQLSACSLNNEKHMKYAAKKV